MIERLFEICITLGEKAFQVFDLLVNAGVFVFEKIGDILTTIGGWIGL